MKAFRQVGPNERSYEKFKDARLDAINQSLRLGSIDQAKAHMAVKNLVADLYRTVEDLQIKLRHTSLTNEHETLLQEFFDKK